MHSVSRLGWVSVPVKLTLVRACHNVKQLCYLLGK